jgi:outer membrane protein assembly factor BamB
LNLSAKPGALLSRLRAQNGITNMAEEKLLHKIRHTKDKLGVMIERLRTGTPKHDWPHPRGPNLNGFSDISGGCGNYMVLFVSEDNFIYAIDLNKNVLWAKEIKEGFESYIGNFYAPAVVDHTIYVTAKNGMLYAIDFKGKTKWSKKIDTSNSSNPSCPVIKEDFMVLGQSKDAYMIDLNGNVIWKISGKGSDYNPPVILDDMILFMWGFNPEKLFALDLEGNEKWQFNIRCDYNHCPVIDDDVIYMATDGDGLYALDFYREKKWNYKIKGLPEARLSTPVIKGDYIVFNYKKNNNSGTVAIDKNGDLIWRKRFFILPDIAYFHGIFPPAFYKDTILIPSYTKIFACDLEGNLLWGDDVSGSEVSTFSTIDGFAVFSNGRGQIITIDPDRVSRDKSYGDNPLSLLIKRFCDKSFNAPKRLWSFDQCKKSIHCQSMPIIIRY